MIDPLGGFNGVRDLFLSYLDTAFRISDERVAERRRELLRTPGTLCTEPLIEPIPRYASAGFRVDELASATPHDDRLPGFNADERKAFAALALSGLLDAERAPRWPSDTGRGEYELYEHQAAMLRRGVQAGLPGIVTSGTGSGKTESFLLPIFAAIAKESVRWPKPDPSFLRNYWWRDPSRNEPYESWDDVPVKPSAASPDATPFRLHRSGEHPGRAKAVRALILYPMNALVEDQLVRLRRALDSSHARKVIPAFSGGNRIFFGRYTSATPVTGFHEHPRLAGRDFYKQKSRGLRRLFTELREMDLTQRECEQKDPNEESDLRFNFPSVDGAELVSRWDIQQTPPDVLITNTSMLSAMLAREVDEPVFSQTRAWLHSDPTAYFFLVLDELHLNRGAAGTELAYLVRTLIRALGLDQPAHRHKLRVLASSASLPVGGIEGERSVRYLWDFFGGNGLHASPGSNVTAAPERWREAIVPGRTLQEKPLATLPLPTAPFASFLYAHSYGDDGVPIPRHPKETHASWALVATALSSTKKGKFEVGNEEELKAAVLDTIRLAAATVARACEIANGGNSRATKVADLARELFGSTEDEALEALRSILFVRGCADRFRTWWPEERSPSVQSFRVHTFFRSIEGLFAAPRPLGAGNGHDRGDRLFGELSVERGSRFGSGPGAAPRFMELLYCECCGELFFGGSPGNQSSGDVVELLPSDPNLEGLPESAEARLFEELSAEDFRVFWPSHGRYWPEGTEEPEPTLSPGRWRKASLDPLTGRAIYLAIGAEAAPNQIPGYLYDPGPESPGWPDAKGRRRSAAGTCVPFECPSCAQSYQQRSARHRLSPIRNFRTGFAKTTQLLASELYSLLRGTDGQPKLVCFSDSRQDAAKAALDIERRHHEDIRRDVLVKAMRDLRAGLPDPAQLTEELRQVEERIRQGDFSLFEKHGELKRLRDSLAEDCVPLGEVADIDPNQATAPLRPLLKTFTRKGIHPVDGAGIAPIEEFFWPELFELRGEDGHWMGDPTLATEVARARATVCEDLQRLSLATIFNKTYFALEESGLGYPCLPLRGRQRTDLAPFDAAIRVLSDSYRYTPKPPDWEESKPWQARNDVSPRTRFHKYVSEYAPSSEVGTRIDDILERLRECGHTNGVINAPSLYIRVARPEDPYWRCSSCSRVHLHRGTGICTRCFRPLEARPSGEARDLWQENFLAKRVQRADGGCRLRCEEMTGATDNPAARLRRFKGVFIRTDEDIFPAGKGVAIPEELNASARTIDVLSVTTTMEVGVDIGTLQGVFQANMPPQRFNYQQRVGRAGRRGQAFSIVLTVCRSKSHDLHYFHSPGQITGDPPPPPFLTKDLPVIGQRLVRKTWLIAAFRWIRRRFPTEWPADQQRTQDIHGEFMTVDELQQNKSRWIPRLRDGLAATIRERDDCASFLASESPLESSALRHGLGVDELVAQIDSLDPAEFASKGIAEALAEQGRLPMYGMPTRTRTLFTHYVEAEQEDGKEGFDWRSIDRDLGLAIYEFSPGSVLVKDKLEHMAIGFTGPYPPSLTRYFERQWIDAKPFGQAFGPPFFLLQCPGCTTWSRLPAKNNSQHLCPGCGHVLSGSDARECLVPNGFRTDFNPRLIGEKPTRGAPQRVAMAEGRTVQLQATAGSNVALEFQSGVTTYRLNRGTQDSTVAPPQWLGFVAEKGDTRYPGDRLTIKEQWIAEPFRDGIGRTFAPLNPAERRDAFWLAAPKTTDSIFLAPRAIHARLRLDAVQREAGYIGVRAAAISAAYLFVYRAAKELDVDPEEFDIIEPRVHLPPQGGAVPLFQITDFLINGSGYCRELSSIEPSGTRMADRLIAAIVRDVNQYPMDDFLKPEHRRRCDSSCYKCLQRFSNQHYHGLLDWRLGLDFLRCVSDPTNACGSDGDFSAASLTDWQALARSYAEEMTRFSPSEAEVRTVGALTSFKLRRRSRVWALIVHPFWDRDGLPAMFPDVWRELGRGGDEIEPVNTFDLARRQVRVWEWLQQREPMPI